MTNKEIIKDLIYFFIFLTICVTIGLLVLSYIGTYEPKKSQTPNGWVLSKPDPNY